MKQMAVLTTLTLLACQSATANDDQMALGKKIFSEQAQPACTVCHTLSDAGSSGAVGPDLDELKPSQSQVREAVRQGVGVMPAFEDGLSAEEIDAVAYYVARVTGGKTE